MPKSASNESISTNLVTDAICISVANIAQLLRDMNEESASATRWKKNSNDLWKAKGEFQTALKDEPLSST